jgi:hypothetical protein
MGYDEIVNLHDAANYIPEYSSMTTVKHFADQIFLILIYYVSDTLFLNVLLSCNLSQV